MKKILFLVVLALAIPALSLATSSADNSDEDPVVCDLNNDKVRNLSDIGLFAGCAETFDVNNDGVHNLTDNTLYNANYQDNNWCRTSFRCAPNIIDYSQYLLVAEYRATNISDQVTRIWWRSSLGSSGEYRYSKNQSELGTLPWRTDGVSNNPDVTGNMFGSQVDLSGLEAGATYYIQVRKNRGSQYGQLKEFSFVPGTMGSYSPSLDIAETRVDQLTASSARIYWRSVNMGSNGWYRYATNTDALSGMNWSNSGVSDDATVTGNINASMMTLNNLRAGTKYYIELKKTAGIAGEISYKYGKPKIIDFTTYNTVVDIPKEKIFVCHITGNDKTNTLEIAKSALAAHLAHGDKQGACSDDKDNGVKNREQEKTKNQGLDKNLVNRVRGRILLQVENNGEAYYVKPNDGKRVYMKDGSVAYGIMRDLGLGIKNIDLAKIPVGFEDRFSDIDTDGDGLADKLEEGLGTDSSKVDTDGDGVNDKAEILAGTNPLGAGKLIYDNSLASRLAGRIVLQVEKHGEAWYINPVDGKRYYMKDGSAAYQIMRYLSLGITNEDLDKIPE